MPEETKKIAGVERNIFWMGLVSFLTDVSSEMIFTVLPLFMSNFLGLSKSVIGLIEGIAESTSSFLKLLSGWLSDKFDTRKPLVVAGYSFSTVVKPLLVLADSWPIILLVRFSDRVGKGIRSAPRDSLVAAYSDAKNRGRSFGFHRMMDTSGAVLGIMIAAVFMALMVNPYQELFLLSVVPGALAVFILMMLVKEKKLEEKKRTVSSFRLELKKFDFRFKIAIAAVIIFSMGNFSYAFSLIRAQEMGVVLVAIPLVYLFCNIIYAIAAYPAGILADRLGKDKVLLSSFILFTIISFAFGFLEGALAAWVIFALYGVFLAVFEVSSKAFVADVAPAELRGTALGIYHAGIGFAAFPASFVLGVLWQGFGSGVGFGYSGILAIVATLLLFLFLIKSGDNSDENEPSGKG